MAERLNYHHQISIIVIVVVLAMLPQSPRCIVSLLASPLACVSV
jgi:hypothetical protein